MRVVSNGNSKVTPRINLLGTESLKRSDGFNV